MVRLVVSDPVGETESHAQPFPVETLKLVAELALTVTFADEPMAARFAEEELSVSGPPVLAPESARTIGMTSEPLAAPVAVTVMLPLFKPDRPAGFSVTVKVAGVVVGVLLRVIQELD